MSVKQHAAFALVKRFIDVDPQQAALALEGLPEAEAAVLLCSLPLGACASCLDHARPDFAAAVIQKLVPEPAAPILARMEPDHAADIIRALPEPARHGVLAGLPPELSRRVCDMLTYPEGSAGRLMKTSVLAFHQDLKIREVIARLRAKSTKRAHTYTYVVGPEHRLPQRPRDAGGHALDPQGHDGMLFPRPHELALVAVSSRRRRSRPSAPAETGRRP